MRYRIAVLATTVALIGGASAAGASYAAITAITEPNANGVITSCYNTTTGVVKMVNATATCAAGSKKLTWASNLKPKVHVVGAAGEVPYATGWKAYNGPPFGNLFFYLDGGGVVHLSGLACSYDIDFPTACKIGEAGGGGELPIFTLPVGFRPPAQQLFTVISAGNGRYDHARLDITTDGVVKLVFGPTAGVAWVSFDGIEFLAQ
jgi:hypothetical protein